MLNWNHSARKCKDRLGVLMYYVYPNRPDLSEQSGVIYCSFFLFFFFFIIFFCDFISYPVLRYFSSCFITWCLPFRKYRPDFFFPSVPRTI